MIKRLLAWLGQPYPGSDRYEALRDALDENTRREDNLAFTMGTIIEPSNALERVLEIREARVAILRDLGWTSAANFLAKDNAMRREWTRRA